MSRTPEHARTPAHRKHRIAAPQITLVANSLSLNMSKQGTVVEQKQLFLQSRKHLLSRGIPPSERLRTIALDGGIELSVLKGALEKGT